MCSKRIILLIIQANVGGIRSREYAPQLKYRAGWNLTMGSLTAILGWTQQDYNNDISYGIPRIMYRLGLLQ